MLRTLIGVTPNGGRACNRRRLLHSTCTVHAQRPRMYRYAIDVHGQLFLHDTRPKNLTSCFKSVQFLNFFLSRIRFNEQEPALTHDVRALKEDWTETLDCTLDEGLAFARSQGYHWLSPCQGEFNVIRAADSPIVFRELTNDGHLVWAGDLRIPFQPDKLRVDADSGYVYHPSPEPSLASLRKLAEQHGPSHHPYGAYSLLSSALVLQRLTEGLDVDPDQFGAGKGGSVQWQGKRYEMSILDKHDVRRERRVRVDDLAE